MCREWFADKTTQNKRPNNEYYLGAEFDVLCDGGGATVGIAGSQQGYRIMDKIAMNKHPNKWHKYLTK